MPCGVAYKVLLTLEGNLYDLATFQGEDQMVALVDLNGLYELIPSLVSIDGIRITAFLQHFLKCLTNLGFPKSGSITVFVIIVFVVAIPNIIALACAPQSPDLVAIELAAIATDNFPGKRVSAKHLRSAFLVFCQYLLNLIEDFWLYDWFMRIMHTDRKYLAVILSNLLGEIVYGKVPNVVNGKAITTRRYTKEL